MNEVWFVVGLLIGVYGVEKGWSITKSISLACFVFLLVYIILEIIDVVINGV